MQLTKVHKTLSEDKWTAGEARCLQGAPAPFKKREDVWFTLQQLVSAPC